MPKGIILLLTAEFLFTVASALAKYVTGHSMISGAEVTFFRFLIGFTATAAFTLRRKLPLKPKNIRLVILRGIFNTLAVILFFAGIKYTTVTNANMLNMAYPVFVFLLAPLINRERSPRVYYLFLISAMTGVYLVAFPDFSTINKGDLLCIASAIAAGFGITTLRQAAKYDDPHIILFYLMGIGTVLNFIIIAPVFTLEGSSLVWIAVGLSALLGYFGQVLITKGYAFISAAGGSLVSTSRIIFAFFIGAVFFGDAITFRIAAGGTCILISLAAMSGAFDALFGIKKRNAQKKISESEEFD